MKGKIVKGIAGFYYVNVEGCGMYECKARGSFRNIHVTPLVGDDVVISASPEEEFKGNIEEILERKNSLIRPAVANVDQAVVLFAMAEPTPNLDLLDRFLIMIGRQDIDAVICFNKTDRASEERILALKEAYQSSGHSLVFSSARLEEGMEQLRGLMRGKTTVLAGPSGVGKSTIMNIMQPSANMETGIISSKLKRGKHTTRHSELFYVEPGTYVLDTPGFTSLMLEELDKNALKDYFNEFKPYEGRCRFLGCLHLHEPGCEVKRALEEKLISKERYMSYCSLLAELEQKDSCRYRKGKKL